jgi:hypothetical protein
MPTRELSIQFDSAGLASLAAAHQQVAVIKPVSGADYLVAWQVFAPLQASTVSWPDSCCVYASTTSLSAGNQLQVVATAAAAGGNTYPFAEGQFGPGVAGLAPTEIGISNQDPDLTIGAVAMLTGGLQQPATVNGTPHTNPVTAEAVLYRQRAVATITDRLLVLTAGGLSAGTLVDPRWFGGFTTGVPVQVVLGDPLAVDLTSVTSQVIHYDSATNQFAPGRAPA